MLRETGLEKPEEEFEHFLDQAFPEAIIVFTSVLKGLPVTGQVMPAARGNNSAPAEIRHTAYFFAQITNNIGFYGTSLRN